MSNQDGKLDIDDETLAILSDMFTNDELELENVSESTFSGEAIPFDMKSTNAHTRIPENDIDLNESALLARVDTLGHEDYVVLEEEDEFDR